MKKLVLFGAGVYAKKYLSLLEFLDIEFDYFTDNNKCLHGDKLFEKEVISPEQLIHLDCEIIISCTHTEAIKMQLKEMGIIHKLIDIKDICRENISLLKNKMRENDFASSNKQCKKQKTNVLIDMYEGIGWGGTEIWAAEAAKGLSAKEYMAIMMGSTLQVPLGKEYEGYVRRITSENTIEQMCKIIEAHLPCVIINNFAGCMFLAASIMKIKYPDYIRIISVIHNDNKGLFDAHMMLKEDIDAIVCVSNRIRDKIISEYGWPSNRIYFKEQPIKCESEFSREYWTAGNPIRIGYAGRIVRQQKRAHQLVNLIELLETKNIDYRLEIAGEGECTHSIHSFVKVRALDDRVRLLGRLEKEKMPDFWKRQDVFINISEYEGTSLAMLEAMSYGCVPVVTDVSGAREFIQDGTNGYICKIDHIEEVADGIEKLVKSQGNIKEFSKKCEVEVRNRCNQSQYIDFLEEIMHNSWS